MNSRERETLPFAVRVRHDSVLVSTENASELESMSAWARRVGVKLEVLRIFSAGAARDAETCPLLQVVEWPLGVESQQLVQTLQGSRSSATVLIIPESVEPNFGHDIPDDWDFVRRPCDCRELTWRADRALSRSMRRESGVMEVQTLVCGPLCHTQATGEILVQDRPLELRRAERDVLLYLMRHSQRFTSAEELQREVLRSHGSGGAARNQIYELRRKLCAVGLEGVIVSKGCEGYRLRWRQA